MPDLEEKEEEKTEEKEEGWEEEGEDASLKEEKSEEKTEEKTEESEEKGEEGSEEKAPTLSKEEALLLEVSELKTRNTTLAQTLRNLEKKVEEHGKTLREADMMEELDEEEAAKVADAQEARAIFLDGLWETMLINPKYEDMPQVVTNYNKQLVVTALSQQLIDEDPTIKMSEAEIAVTQAIEDRKNPHKFYYDNIKLLEEQSQKSKEGEEKKEKEVKKKDPEMKDSPGSVNSMGGGSNDQGQWTMSKLDNMSEDEMIKSKIPEDILQQWKEEKLPK
jgi:hypothetical protein